MFAETTSESGSTASESGSTIANPSKRPKVNKKQVVDNKKQKKTTLTIAQKIELCQKKVADSKLSNIELATHYKIGQSTVHDILKKSDHYLSLDSTSPLAQSQREKPPKFPKLEEALAIWLNQAVNANATISGHILLRKAAIFAELMNIPNFGGSSGWLHNFKKRYGIQEYNRCGESNSAPLSELPQYRETLRDLLKNYSPDDIYNCDETGLYWKMEPSKTLSSHPTSGTKKPKDRVTVMLTCNATGTDKLVPVFIHRYKTPRCMRNIKKDSLPVYYYANSSAWMASNIFVHWLGKLNGDMRCAKKKILLLLDNATSHTLPEGVAFSNVQLHYLPPNTTAHLQPCDAGIIHSFKAQYRQLLCENRIDAYDESIATNKPPLQLDILDAIRFTASAWRKVKTSTIVSCWQKTEILPFRLFESSEENNEVTTVQFLINQLSILGTPMTAEEFIMIDENMMAEEAMGDEEIVRIVNQTEEEEVNGCEVEENISTSAGLASLDTLVKFISQQEGGFEVEERLCQDLRRHRRNITNVILNSRKQVTIDMFFKSNQ
jgi:hypothetical protein